MERWGPIFEKNGLIRCIQGPQREGSGGGSGALFFLPSENNFHGKAALINMALKPRTLYFVHKDHCEAFKFLLHTVCVMQ